MVGGVVQRDDFGAVGASAASWRSCAASALVSTSNSPSMTDSVASAHSFAAWPIISCS
ncbi:Uncharacterised protein [Mycobacteroides abscessus subsp. abscessus]|nr:Uncharacterised protein [Mycobacteroides abscessus subsp. abscessus]